MRRVPLRLGGILTPLDSRLPRDGLARSEVLRLHELAVRQSSSGYRDPSSGLFVFTAQFLADRGYCCDSGCRHCPYQEPDGDQGSTDMGIP